MPAATKAKAAPKTKAASKTKAAAPAWRMRGQYASNCSCDAGCPCQFNRLPTHTVCEGILWMNVTGGTYGETPLAGTKWAVVFKFPGPLHQGHGIAQPFIDASATVKQRNALLQILSGASGSPWFGLIASVVSKMEAPQFVPLEMQLDVKKRRGNLKIKGQMEHVAEPVKNPVSGAEHQAQISLPNGIEYKLAEVASATVMKSTGKLKFNWPNGSSLLAEVEHSAKGIKQIKP